MTVLSVVSSSVLMPLRGDGTDDLKQMAIEYFEYQGVKWDEKKYWGYGCHCIIGDRSITSGLPVDRLDHACFQYKMCQKCVRDEHGDKCVGAGYRYQWNWNKRHEILEILSIPATCERELGECDRKFVHDMYRNRAVYSDAYSYHYGNFDRLDSPNCPTVGAGANGIGGHGSGGNGAGVRNAGSFQCCGGYNTPWLWINTNHHQCCPLGNTAIVKRLGSIC